jgi:hypothetical protein
LWFTECENSADESTSTLLKSLISVPKTTIINGRALEHVLAKTHAKGGQYFNTAPTIIAAATAQSIMITSRLEECFHID